MRLEFSGQIFEKFSNIKLREIRLVGTELFHADGQTDMTKLTVAFCDFANASKNVGAAGAVLPRLPAYLFTPALTEVSLTAEISRFFKPTACQI